MGDVDELSRLFVEHEMWLTVERGLSPNSIASYRRDLRRYAAYLAAAAKGPTDLSEDTVARYVGRLADARDEEGRRQFAPASVARALAAVRSFHRFCAAEGLLARDLGDDVGAPPVPRGAPKALTEEQVTDLIDAVAGDSPTSRRDRAILEVLYGSGMRISELVGLDLASIDHEEGFLRVLGKGSKERVVPFAGSAAACLTAYLEGGRPQLLAHAGARRSDRDAIFLNVRGGRLTRQGCWGVVRRSGRLAGIEQALSPHVLRHSCATHMLDRGADIRYVQELLGHARISTTQIYTKVSVERLREVFDAAHPRARLPTERTVGSAFHG